MTDNLEQGSQYFVPVCNSFDALSSDVSLDDVTSITVRGNNVLTSKKPCDSGYQYLPCTFCEILGQSCCDASHDQVNEVAKLERKIQLGKVSTVGMPR